MFDKSETCRASDGEAASAKNRLARFSGRQRSQPESRSECFVSGLQLAVTEGLAYDLATEHTGIWKNGREVVSAHGIPFADGKACWDLKGEE